MRFICLIFFIFPLFHFSIINGCWTSAFINLIAGLKNVIKKIAKKGRRHFVTSETLAQIIVKQMSAMKEGNKAE